MSHDPKSRAAPRQGGHAARRPDNPGTRDRRGGVPRPDAANLAGITTLMNPLNVKAGVNLGEVEKAVMGKSGGGGRRAPELDPVRLYTEELNQLASELGIDLLDEGVAPAAPRTPALGGAAPRAPPTPAPQRDAARPAPRERGPVHSRIDDLIDDLDLDLDLGGRGTRSGGRAADRARDRPRAEGRSAREDEGGSAEDSDCDCDSDCADSCDCDCHEECDCDDDCADSCDCDCHDESEEDSRASRDDNAEVDRILARFGDDLGFRADRSPRRGRERHGVVHSPHERRAPLTDEQEQRRHISSVMRDLRGETRTVPGEVRERVLDSKASKLDQISSLRAGLEKDGVDCSSVFEDRRRRPLSSESSMEEIDSVLNILRLKNDRNRYSTFAEEIVLGAAEWLESVFDGSRAVPLVGWRPDYSGYHNSVNVKLHRMRHETSQVVGAIITRYHIGPTARIIMELLPSFFLYPHQQKRQRGVPGLASDPHVADSRHAFAAIRASDERKTLDDARRV